MLTDRLDVFLLLSPQGTFSAVYAILLGLSTGQLDDPTNMTVRVGGRVLATLPSPPHANVDGDGQMSVGAEAGTGYMEHRWLGSDVNASLGRVDVGMAREGIAWGGLHWQRFGSTAHTAASSKDLPLSLTKEVLGREAGTESYMPLAQVSIRPGVDILVRLIVKCDRYVCPWNDGPFCWFVLLIC